MHYSERVPLDTFQKVAPDSAHPMLKRIHSAQQHSLSQEASHILQCSEPIKFFEAVFRPYKFNSNSSTDADIQEAIKQIEMERTYIRRRYTIYHTSKHIQPVIVYNSSLQCYTSQTITKYQQHSTQHNAFK